jgi:hypothetical protein
MANFVEATEHNVHMHAKFGDFNLYVFFKINILKFDL